MSDEHPLGDRGHALEEEYFRKKDRELVENMRRASTAADARRELSSRSGVQDPQLLQELEVLGFTPHTVALLPFVPLVQMAWAEGGVTAAERQLVVQLARARGVEEGGLADRQLAAWLTDRPSPQVFASASRLIRAMLDAPSAGATALSAEELVKHCEDIAAASGGMLGIHRVSSEERALLQTLARELKR